jgi:hypothetical protein
MNGTEEGDDLAAWEQALFTHAAPKRRAKRLEPMPSIDVQRIQKSATKAIEKVDRAPISNGGFDSVPRMVILEAKEVVRVVPPRPQALFPTSIVPVSMVPQREQSPSSINVPWAAELIGVLTIRAMGRIAARFAVGEGLKSELAALARDTAEFASVRLSTGRGDGQGHYQRTRPEGGGWTDDDTDPAQDCDWWNVGCWLA